MIVQSKELATIKAWFVLYLGNHWKQESQYDLNHSLAYDKLLRQVFNVSDEEMQTLVNLAKEGKTYEISGKMN